MAEPRASTTTTSGETWWWHDAWEPQALPETHRLAPGRHRALLEEIYHWAAGLPEETWNADTRLVERITDAGLLTPSGPDANSPRVRHVYERWTLALVRFLTTE